MRTLLAAAALLFALPLCAQPDLREAADSAKQLAAKAKERSHTRVYDSAGIVVVEKDDDEEGYAHYLDNVTVITASKEKKAQFAMLLKASYLKPGSPMERTIPDLGQASVYTLDEYMDLLAEGSKQNRKRYEKEHPGQKYPWDDDARDAATRAELEGRLKGHDAVVLRYIHIKRDGEK